ncbi:MFS transporter [Streptomyces nigra]|uniref:MFS transporter n=1 Tax=Streptomyces nigra TaxID=1827580 RepID=UPI0036B527A4
MKHTVSRTLPRVLRRRDARLCLAAVLVSGFGTSALWLVAGVWVKDLTGSDGLAALCLLALWAPTAAGPVLGALADTVRRGPLLIGLHLLPAALLPVLTAVDSPGRVWLVFAVLFVYGAVGVVQDAAESALVAGAVPASLLGEFNGLRMTVSEGLKLVAPPTGAVLYGAYGADAVVLLDAASFVLAAGLYACLRAPERSPALGRVRKVASSARRAGRAASGACSRRAGRAPAYWLYAGGRPVRRECVPGVERQAGLCGHDLGERVRIAEGARHLWRHPRLRPLVLAGGATMLCAGVNGAALYAVIDALGHAPAYAGVLYAVQGAGSVVAGLLAGPALRRLGAHRLAGYGIAVTAVAAGLRAVPSDAVALLCSAAIGAGLPCVLIAAFTAVQRETPDALLGRTAATAHTLVLAPNAVGLAVGAALVEVVDVAVLLAALGVVWAASAALPRQSAASPSRTADRSSSDANPA